MSSTIAPLLPGLLWVNRNGQLTDDAADFINFVLIGRLQAAAVSTTTPIALTGQNASIATTPIATVPAGRYRVSWYFRITTVGTIASTLQLTMTGTDGGVTCPQSSANYAGNLTNAPQSGSFVVVADGSTPISYATTYTSNAAGTMIYSLSIVLESLP